MNIMIKVCRLIVRISVRLFLLLCIQGCFLVPPENPPFLVSSVQVVNGILGEQRIGSVQLTLINKSDSSLRSVFLEFDVYDTQGRQQPAPGDNHVTSRIARDLPPGGETVLEVSLDPLFVFPPAENLTVTRLCLVELEFEDGILWSDPGRYYLIMAEDVTVEEIQ